MTKRALLPNGCIRLRISRIWSRNLACRAGQARHSRPDEIEVEDPVEREDSSSQSMADADSELLHRTAADRYQEVLYLERRDVGRRGEWKARPGMGKKSVYIVISANVLCWSLFT